MTTPLHPLVSPQANKVYQLLSTDGPLTAAEIGERLGILPNAVYRAAKQLLAPGIVRKTHTYPVRFQAVESEAALGWYLLAARRAFMQTFPAVERGRATKGHSPTITLIKDRTTLLRQTDRDTAQAQRSIHFIVSGLEVPDQTILAYRQARARGVTIQALVQRRQETSAEKLERWRDIGVSARATADMGLRLFVFDSRVVYFTSYAKEAKNQAFGIRFEYPPIAAVMDELFAERWALATPLA